MDHPSQGRSQWIDLRLADEYAGGLWAVIGQKSMSRGKAHLATNINSKQGASGPIPMPVPVVLVPMHWPLHLIAIISPDLPRSQHANTDISGDLALV